MALMVLDSATIGSGRRLGHTHIYVYGIIAAPEYFASNLSRKTRARRLVSLFERTKDLK